LISKRTFSRELTMSRSDDDLSILQWTFIILCLPCLCVCVALDGDTATPEHIERRNQRAARREAKRLEKESPPALKERKRPLSPPLEPRFRFSLTRKKTASQDKSPLLTTLPWEIRRVIWEKVLGGEMFHIIRMKKKISFVRCTMQNEFRGDTVHHRCWGFYERPQANQSHLLGLPGLYHGPRTGFSSHEGGLLPLLKTCRQV
jgi:hypothetical protein